MPTRRATREGVPTPSKTAAETRRIMEKLAAQHPNADTELKFTTPYELLVATILSAQCTDERVNQVTPALFRRYPNARALARASPDELEPQIQSTGFFRAKSKSLVGMAHAVVQQHGGEIPGTMDALVSLPGVGRKTANVVLGHALGVPGLPVDRHVLRVSNRIGIARSDDPEVVERQLCGTMPHTKWTLTSDTLILHGRRICKPRPLCDRCAVREHCDYYRSVMSAVTKASAARPASNARRMAKLKRSARGGAARKAADDGSPVDGRRAVKKRGAAGGAPTTDSEIAAVPEIRRASKMRGTDRAAPPNDSERASTSGIRRASKTRGTERGGGPAKGTENGSMSELRRASKTRGPGGGGAAAARLEPSGEATASRAGAQRRREAPPQTRK